MCASFAFLPSAWGLIPSGVLGLAMTAAWTFASDDGKKLYSPEKSVRNLTQQHDALDQRLTAAAAVLPVAQSVETQAAQALEADQAALGLTA